MGAGAAARRGIPCALCGAMAGHLLAVPIILGLGITELSVEPAAVPEVKAVIARTDLVEARGVAERALMLGTADDVEALVETTYGERLADLLSAGEQGNITDTGTFLIRDIIKAPGS
jgi:phosphotransferase system enzyme I (PtsI)